MSDERGHALFEKDVPLIDAPAFVRRARQVEAASTALVENCARERMRLLEMPRMRLARLFALAPGDSDPSFLYCDHEDFKYLQRLHHEWQPRLIVPLSPARTATELKRAIAELGASFERFNRRWLKLLNDIDLSLINRLREDYNRFYLLEKECALRSTRIARDGFHPLEPVTMQSLLAEFPLLMVPG